MNNSLARPFSHVIPPFLARRFHREMESKLLSNAEITLFQENHLSIRNNSKLPFFSHGRSGSPVSVEILMRVFDDSGPGRNKRRSPTCEEKHNCFQLMNRLISNHRPSFLRASRK